MALPYYLGCPQWQDPNWNNQLPPGGTPLARYARVFNTVEGNTTFYASPSRDQCLQWRQQVPDSFRFLFKLPRAITHERFLTGVGDELDTFLSLIEPLNDVLGPMLLQLPAGFGPQRLDQLWYFLDTAPEFLHWTVEVRHPAFFAKGEEERTLNQGLRAESWQGWFLIAGRCSRQRPTVNQPSMPSARSPAFRCTSCSATRRR